VLSDKRVRDVHSARVRYPPGSAAAGVEHEPLRSKTEEPNPPAVSNTNEKVEIQGKRFLDRDGSPASSRFVPQSNRVLAIA